MSTDTVDRVMIDAGMVMDDLDALADRYRTRFNAQPWWRYRQRWHAYGAWKVAEAYRNNLLDQMAKQFGLSEWKGDR
jgi:hypothetical protein